ncbi:MAG: hypothetical protein WBF90_08190 [Rivularia sp. (in: cyanobacteria)]
MTIWKSIFIPNTSIPISCTELKFPLNDFLQALNVARKALIDL